MIVYASTKRKGGELATDRLAVFATSQVRVDLVKSAVN